MNLKMLTSNTELYDCFLEELDDRIELARKQLENREDLVEIYRFQGEIRAFNRLKLLKETLRDKDRNHVG